MTGVQPESVGGLRILTVCTMNICRSPAMEELFRQGLAQVSDVSVSSAGTHAVAGAASCDLSMAMIGHGNHTHSATPITEQIIRTNDLIVTAATDHVAEIVRMTTSARSYTFTLRQAARYATWIVQGGSLEVATRKAAGEQIEVDLAQPMTMTEPLPDNPTHRLPWLVNEMHAARGLAPMTDRHSLPPALAVSPDDIPDPHVMGFDVHPISSQLIVACTDDFLTAVSQILTV